MIFNITDALRYADENEKYMCVSECPRLKRYYCKMTEAYDTPTLRTFVQIMFDFWGRWFEALYLGRKIHHSLEFHLPRLGSIILRNSPTIATYIVNLETSFVSSFTSISQNEYWPPGIDRDHDQKSCMKFQTMINAFAAYIFSSIMIILLIEYMSFNRMIAQK